ncbi:DUF1510 family protein [Rummeliibacillus sp. G93]|uniref:YrrS family protein n=1 Tax=Rummeliibacillus TaxID=648802 RepID=UPI00116968BE|nr:MULTISPECIES: YrrS family protein [Rummeliibacillus]MBB5169664.1 FtsZ-interacting cell division protein ZipA [Rummeliibacillus stabekisii]UQW98586.1 DUF1510 family protein [Rummeliibacillus sp. G93]GEL03921.1 putative membrane protein YrrS [Rummeliibacillus stabekisii]
MAEIGRRYNPNGKKPKNTDKKKMDKILNVLIGVVAALILVVAGFIVIGGSHNKDTKSDKVAQQTPQENESEKDNIVEKDSKELEKEKAKQAEEAKKEKADASEEESDAQAEDDNSSSEQEETASDEDNNSASDETQDNEESKKDSDQYSHTAKVEDSNDPNVKKVVTDSKWKPTKTKQKESSDVHNSSYTKGSLDWNEKIKTIAHTTGLDENDMIIWYVKNGGSPNTSIGIVSSNDKTKNYRVSMEWIPNKGWKPTKLEVLKTHQGAY